MTIGLNAFYGILTLFQCMGLSIKYDLQNLTETMCEISKYIILQLIFVEKLLVFCLNKIGHKFMSHMFGFRGKFSPDQYTILSALINLHYNLHNL